METYTAPDHWELCQVPINGTFVSSSVELMRLGKLIPPWLTSKLDAIGWSPKDVDHYVLHQPSEVMVRKLLDDMGVEQERGVHTHSLYGNTASASVAVTYHQLLKERQPKPGDKIVLGSAAAGFTMVFIAGEWTGG
jgi:3-oxoacyl-[acyl-carrier-protein] synthase-3